MPKYDKPFVGPFAQYLQSMLDEKRVMGLKYNETARQMHKLDELTCQFDCSNGLSKELVMIFTERKPNWHQSTQEHLITTTREVAAYLIRNGVPAYIIDKSRVTKRYENFKPYIFTHMQIQLIFNEADSIKPRKAVNSHVFYPTILRVQYGCGLRISETLNLKMKDVDLKENLLYVYDSKNHKDRIVPMDSSVASFCERYAAIIHPVYQENDYFFQSRWGDGHYEKGSIYHYFRELLFKCGISHGGRRNSGPRLHDLRHSFCVHSLENMMKQGISHQVALPLLSAYMGHASLSATGRYLRLTAEAFPELKSQIEKIYEDVIPDLEVKFYEEID